MEAKEQVKIIVKALEDKKAADISVLDISRLSIMADYFIIASGANKNQIGAMIEEIEEKLYKAGIRPKAIEGSNTSGWVLMDYQDIVIHIFDTESRAFYDLERIWGDSRVIKMEELQDNQDNYSEEE
ncbi:MAG: ribosome silencing factor [Lachnospiraceae bacterium]|nr:ribosome silencing factor [Lachnospiraceae bacterium]